MIEFVQNRKVKTEAMTEKAILAEISNWEVKRDMANDQIRGLEDLARTRGYDLYKHEAYWEYKSHVSQANNILPSLRAQLEVVRREMANNTQSQPQSVNPSANSIPTAKTSGLNELEDKRRDIMPYRYCIAADNDKILGLRTDGAVVVEHKLPQCDVQHLNGVTAILDAGSVICLKDDGSLDAANEAKRSMVADLRDVVAFSGSVWLKADGTVGVIDTPFKEYCTHEDGRSFFWDWQDITAISSTSGHVIGLKADGTVISVQTTLNLSQNGQCNVHNWHDIVAISTGREFTIGLKSDGTVLATKNDRFYSNVQWWRNIVAIASSGTFILGLSADGTVVSNRKNEMGFDIHDWRDIVAIAANGEEAVGLRSDGTVVKTSTLYDGVKNWTSIGPKGSIFIPVSTLKTDAAARAVRKTPIIGSTIKFGDHYWLVLAEHDERALILSKTIIEDREYNTLPCTWADSELRDYLNGAFYNTFATSEKARIIPKNITTGNNPWFGSYGGRTTNDKIFLLSIEEVIKYFGDSGDLASRVGWCGLGSYSLANTDMECWYVNDQHNKARTAYSTLTYLSGAWWLRSPGCYSDGRYASSVEPDGVLNIKGNSVNYDFIGVRPAMWLILEEKDYPKPLDPVYQGTSEASEIYEWL